MIILISSLPYYTGLPKPVLRGQISNKNDLKFMLGNIVVFTNWLGEMSEEYETHFKDLCQY